MNPNTPNNQPIAFPQAEVQPPQSPVAPSFQAPQPELKKPFNKKLFIIVTSVIAGILLIIGAILLYAANVRATPEDYKNAQALVVKIEAQNESSREAYGRSIAIATTEMTTKPVTQADYTKLYAYDRNKELTASNDTLRTETKALEVTLNQLKDSPALKDKAVHDKYEELRKNADAYILSSQQLFESSPALAQIVTACFQAETNIFTLIDQVLTGTDKVVGEINGTTAAYDPDTALAKFEAKPFYVKCNGALVANNKPVSHPSLEGIRQLMEGVMAGLRTQVTDYATEYKKGDKEAAAQSFIDNTKKIDDLITNKGNEMKKAQEEYLKTLDIEVKSNELQDLLAERLA
jgi:hypothetical protein